MKKMSKLLLSLLLVVMMVVSLLPTTALAAEEETTYAENEQTINAYVGQKVDAAFLYQNYPVISDVSYTMSFVQDGKDVAATDVGFHGSYNGRQWVKSNGSYYSIVSSTAQYYGVVFTNMYATEPCTFYLTVNMTVNGEAVTFVDQIIYKDPTSTKTSSLTLTAGETEDVTIVPTFDDNSMTNVAVTSATSADSSIATLTTPSVSSNQILFNISGVAAGNTAITVKSTGEFQVGPSLFGTYSTITATLTDTINVTVNEPAPTTYTVTYTDGVAGETVFEDQVFTVNAGSATPTFDGTPTRDGYTFNGWYPEVAATVTASATYTAQWTKDEEPAPTDPTPTDPTPSEPTPSTPTKVSEPGMDKGVVGDADIKPGDTVSYTLTSTVPQDLQNSITYSADQYGNVTGKAGTYKLTFHDQMANGLTLTDKAIAVTIDGTAIGEKYYTLTTTDLTDGCAFHVELDLAALYNDGLISEAQMGLAPIVVTYEAKLSEDADPGAYQNKAWVNWESDQATGSSSVDTEEVYTFGITIYKYDATALNEATPYATAEDLGLAGAKFQLKDAEGNEIATLATDEDGKLSFNGLKEGSYTLTETEAPDGYIRLSDPITVTVSKDTAGEDYIVEVEIGNAKAPSTGGSGTYLFTFGGIVILCLAGVVFVISRRKKVA